MEEETTISTAERIHDGLLELPWLEIGMGLNWTRLDHFAVNLVEDSVDRESLAKQRALLVAHRYAVLMSSTTLPAVLAPIFDAIMCFDEILSGPGFILGSDLSGDTVEIHVPDFAFYNGADHVSFACGRCPLAGPVVVSLDSLEHVNLEESCSNG